MIHLSRPTLATAALLLSSTALWAQATHPETGEALAEDQSFTYRMLDEWKSIDPQLVEETAGNHAARDLFEGLYNSAPDGTIEPASRFPTRRARTTRPTRSRCARTRAGPTAIR